MDLERARGEGGGRWAVRRGGGSGVNGKLYEGEKKRLKKEEKRYWSVSLEVWGDEDEHGGGGGLKSCIYSGLNPV